MSPPVRPFLVVVVVVNSDGSEPSCFEVLAIIQCYVDGECGVSVMVAIASHLDRCGHCSCELESLRWLKAAVRRCGGPGAPQPERLR